MHGQGTSCLESERKGIAHATITVKGTRQLDVDNTNHTHSFRVQHAHLFISASVPWISISVQRLFPWKSWQLQQKQLNFRRAAYAHEAEIIDAVSDNAIKGVGRG